MKAFNVDLDYRMHRQRYTCISGDTCSLAYTYTCSSLHMERHSRLAEEASDVYKDEWSILSCFYGLKCVLSDTWCFLYCSSVVVVVMPCSDNSYGRKVFL